MATFTLGCCGRSSSTVLPWEYNRFLACAAHPSAKLRSCTFHSVEHSCSASFPSALSIRKVWREVKDRRHVARLPRPASIRCESGSEEKIPFGYTRKDVLVIGLGVFVFGVGLKYGLEFLGVDPMYAGNAVQLIVVLGLTVGWVATYVSRVSSKDMTYAKQLKDYENKVMEKRLDELPEAELESMLAQVEEEKRILKLKRDKRLSS